MKQSCKGHPNDRIFIPKSRLPSGEQSSVRACAEKLTKAESVTLPRSNNWFSGQSVQLQLQPQQGTLTPQSNPYNNARSNKLGQFTKSCGIQPQQKQKEQPRKHSTGNLQSNRPASSSAFMSNADDINWTLRIDDTHEKWQNEQQNINSVENGSNCESYLPIELMSLCPELYQSYRTQTLLQQHKQQTFNLKIFSKGRKQIKYADGTIEVYLSNQPKPNPHPNSNPQDNDNNNENGDQIVITRWTNGNFKMNSTKEGKVCYWNQQLKQFDYYYIC